MDLHHPSFLYNIEISLYIFYIYYTDLGYIIASHENGTANGSHC